MRTVGTALLMPLMLAAGIAIVAAEEKQSPAAGQDQATVDRTVLPLAEPTYPPITELDVRKATPPSRFEVKAPQGAPNVLVILLDNLGYGATKPFGGVINMPTLERLAETGLIYNNFHTTPLCSPSRGSLSSSLYGPFFGICLSPTRRARPWTG